MKTRILVIGALPPPTGGMETVMEQMCSLNLAEYQIIPFNVAKNNIIRFNFITNSVNFFYRCIKLFFYILFLKPEIIHIHMADGLDFLQKKYYIIISKLLKRKIILHMHGAQFDIFYNNYKNKDEIKRILNMSNRVIVLSKYWFKFYKKIIAEEKLVIINNAVENIDKSKYKRIYPKSDFIVLYLSRLCQRKGVYDLFEAIAIIKDKRFKFVFVGPSDDEQKIAQEVSRLGIRDRCEFVGEIVGKQRYRYFASADLFVLPSYHEGLPVAILEAMAFGLPIISTKVGAIPEVIKRDNGFLIRPGDYKKLSKYILQLVSDRRLKNKFSKNNLICIKKFSLPEFQRNIEDLYGKKI